MTTPSSPVTYHEKIIILWAVFLLGTLFHTQLALIPLFHGLGVAHTHDESLNNIMGILWGMLAFFLVPMGLMIASVFLCSRRYRKFHFVLTLIYSILNLIHLVADLLVTPIVWPQIVLMLVLFLVGLLLNQVSWQWVRRYPDRYGVQSIPIQQEQIKP